MAVTTTSRSRNRKGEVGADRGTVIVTAISALLAWLGIGISLYSSFTGESPRPASEEVQRVDGQ